VDAVGAVTSFASRATTESQAGHGGSIESIGDRKPWRRLRIVGCPKKRPGGVPVDVFTGVRGEDVLSRNPIVTTSSTSQSSGETDLHLEPSAGT
jgi:hypothetical protein